MYKDLLYKLVVELKADYDESIDFLQNATDREINEVFKK